MALLYSTKTVVDETATSSKAYVKHVYSYSERTLYTQFKLSTFVGSIIRTVCGSFHFVHKTRLLTAEVHDKTLA